jgi:hypothetical protein
MPLTAQAQKYNELVNPELIPAEYRTQGFDRARQAVVRFNDECTGTFISNQGHLLTALHCLNPRVSKNLKALDTKLELGVDHNRRFYLVGQTAEFSVYKFAGAGNDLVSMGNNLTGKILVTGKGYYLQMDHFKAARKNPKIYQELISNKVLNFHVKVKNIIVKYWSYCFL